MGTSSSKKKCELELGKRRMVDIHISEGTLKDIKEAEKKKKKENMEVDEKIPEVVLENQHRLHQ